MTAIARVAKARALHGRTRLALNATNGVLYVSDQNFSKIRKVQLSTGVVSTVSASF